MKCPPLVTEVAWVGSSLLQFRATPSVGMKTSWRLCLPWRQSRTGSLKKKGGPLNEKSGATQKNFNYILDMLFSLVQSQLIVNDNLLQSRGRGVAFING
jgi:hypothetical protein